jgi:hypothetical protein
MKRLQETLLMKIQVQQIIQLILKKLGKLFSRSVSKKIQPTDLGPGRYGKFSSLLKNSYNVNFNPSLKSYVKKIY